MEKIKITDIYSEVGENNRFYLDWRYKLLSGFIMMISGIAMALWNIYDKNILFLLIITTVATILSIIFLILDSRTKELYQICQEAGKSIEDNNEEFDDSVKLYKKLVDSKTTFSHTNIIQFLYLISSIAFFLLSIIIAILLI